MSSQELKELNEIRRRNRTVYEQVVELRQCLNQQIKADAGKACMVRSHQADPCGRGRGFQTRKG